MIPHTPLGADAATDADDAPFESQAEEEAALAQLLAYVDEYRPRVVSIHPTLKSFVPDYIPAVGHPDAFVKVGAA
jgi:hypothetical protein